jgi:hypothetical protein
MTSWPGEHGRRRTCSRNGLAARLCRRHRGGRSPAEAGYGQRAACGFGLEGRGICALARGGGPWCESVSHSIRASAIGAVCQALIPTAVRVR